MGKDESVTIEIQGDGHRETVVMKQQGSASVRCWDERR